MGFLTYVTHRIIALALTGAALVLGFAAWGMYLQGDQNSMILTGGSAIVMGFSAAYFWQTVH
jgi:cytochrome bd-type quinol oxidase subunit 1